MSGSPEEVYAEAVAEWCELRRVLLKKELREPEFKFAAIEALIEGGETKTDAGQRYKLDPEFQTFKTELLEAELAVERQAALVEIRKAQLTKWSLTQEVTT